MDFNDKSFQLRYVGQRFNGARLPLEVLTDLPAFRDLLAAYAKDNWRGMHADRQRLPKGFDQSIAFDLVALEEGSAVPRLDWSHQAAQSYLPGFGTELSDIVGSSFEKIVVLIDDAAHDRFPKTLSSDHIRALNKLGAGLRPGERIEFLGSKGSDGNVVYLDTYRRKSLITHVQETYQTRFEGIGVLHGLHIDGQIIVMTDQYGEVRLSVDPDRISSEFDGNTGSNVQFSLQVELDNNDILRSVVEIYDIDLIDAELSDNLLKCKKRIDELRGLNAGWLNGVADAPSGTALAAAERFLLKRPSHAGSYRIYPTADGGIVFEFDLNGWDYSVEFSSNGAGEMYGIEIDGDDELEPVHFPEIDDYFFGFFDQRVVS